MIKTSTRRQQRTLWLFTAVTVLYLAHYALFLSRMTPRFQRYLDHTIQEATMDLPRKNDLEASSASASPGTAAVDGKVGMITCLDGDRESVLQVLALARALHVWREGTVSLEIYFSNGQLSRFLQAHLETHYSSIVTMIDLSWYEHSATATASPTPSSDDNLCLARALNMTTLTHALVVPPSIQFLQNPTFILEELKATQKQQHEAGCRKFVTLAAATTSQLVVGGGDKNHKQICQVPLSSFTSSTETVHHASLNKTMHIATIHSTRQGLNRSSRTSRTRTNAAWMEFSPRFLQWYSVNDWGKETFTLQTTKSTTRRDDLSSISAPSSSSSSQQITAQLQLQQLRLAQARRLILLDRPIAWVAFDTGFHAGHTATLNTLQAANASLQAGTKMLNIDIALTADRQLVAVHNDKSITPADFAGSKLQKTILESTAEEALRLVNPCLPRDIVTSSLLPNPYQPYRCQPEPVALVSDFVRLVQEHDNKNNHDHKDEPTEIILDLKAPQVALQVEQARILATKLAASTSLAVRFFSVYEEEDRLAATVFPEEALQALRTDVQLQEIGYYVNVPSALACRQMAAWIYNQTDFVNKNIRGCYVIQKHANIAASWEAFAKQHDINRYERPSLNISSISAVVTTTQRQQQSSLKYICDVPRKQSFVDPSLWAKEYVSCVQDGFDYIHDPFPPPFITTSSAPPMMETQQQQQAARVKTNIPEFGQLARRIIEKNLLVFNFRKARGRGQVSLWGFGTATDAVDYQWFEGATMIEQGPRTVLTKTDLNYRCITKVLTIMLFLKFQEMGYLNIYDKIIDGDGHTHPMTYRQLFSSVSGLNGTAIGEEFSYGNGHWYVVPGAFERITGLPFLGAVQEYVVEPMGLTGQFDATNKTLPPLAGRGYSGDPSDLTVIGATLAAGGVSPRTRKQIVSPESVRLMQQDTINTPRLKESFENDHTLSEMRRVYNRTGLLPDGFCQGYAMGLWTINGWRHSAQGQPIKAFLSQGSGMVYMDTTGLVLSFKTRGMFTASIVRAFVKIVRELGNAILDYGPGFTVEPLQEQVDVPWRMTNRNKTSVFWGNYTSRADYIETVRRAAVRRRAARQKLADQRRADAKTEGEKEIGKGKDETKKTESSVQPNVETHSDKKKANSQHDIKAKNGAKHKPARTPPATKKETKTRKKKKKGRNAEKKQV